MKFNRRARLDPSQVSDQRGRPVGRTAAAGGGIGVIVLALIALLTGTNPADLLGDGTSPAVRAEPGAEGELEQECQLVADIEENPDCRFVLYVNSAQDFWGDYFAAAGQRYSPARTTFFTAAVDTGCGRASSQVGPFYCPGDQNVYLDLGFFDDLRTTYGGPSGMFAEAYVLAHEYGHHVQFRRDVFDELTTPEESRRAELMADGLASYHLTHARGTAMQWKRVQRFSAMFANIGDCDFAYLGHHGTPAQRARAGAWGYDLVKSAPDQGHVLPSATVTALFDEALPQIVAPDA